MYFKLLKGNNFVKCKWNSDEPVGLQEILVRDSLIFIHFGWKVTKFEGIYVKEEKFFKVLTSACFARQKANFF